MPELSCIEAFGLGIGVHWSRGVIAHFTPLDSTFNHLRRKWSIKIFGSFLPDRSGSPRKPSPRRSRISSDGIHERSVAPPRRNS
jgi:hypothetical protein